MTIKFHFPFYFYAIEPGNFLVCLIEEINIFSYYCIEGVCVRYESFVLI